ncbi:hypothetical protein SAMN05421748_10892 [Paractinoplanes atraurantiacus]|uniref:Uncharacterized protein n=1 Tax=Paractinoplanes atraurantiacus TaxID=1036182 RepID=A0A285IGZ9_9ACTN|nr:hypothetical protein SAMN05421748_10892 [Actinoplanes atraurantiacus]
MLTLLTGLAGGMAVNLLTDDTGHRGFAVVAGLVAAVTVSAWLRKVYRIAAAALFVVPFIYLLTVWLLSDVLMFLTGSRAAALETLLLVVLVGSGGARAELTVLGWTRPASLALAVAGGPPREPTVGAAEKCRSPSV